MVSLTKKFVLTLIFIIPVLGLCLINFCVAPVTVPTNPSAAPEITVEINSNPIWCPPIYSTHPYTGEVTQERPGFYSQNGAVVITIKNRPFTPYIDKNGNNISVYYSIFTKSASYSLWDKYPQYVAYQSDDTCTVLTFAYGEKISGAYVLTFFNGEIDFRIQAVIGYFKPGEEITGPFPQIISPVYEGEGSCYVEFSIKIPSGDEPGLSRPDIKPSSVVPSPLNPSTPSTSEATYTNSPQKPYQTYLTVIILAAVFLITIPLVFLAYQHGQRKTKPTQTSSTAP